MTQTKPRFLSFADYLNYDDGTDKLYELFNGELIELPPKSGENVQIANRLFLQFVLLLGTDRVRGHGLELEVFGEPQNRYPDLTILRPEHIEQLQNRNTIRLEMAPPMLVLEVVSPGELQRERDYRAQREQYQALGIPEYWIVDPSLQLVTILILNGPEYREQGMYQGLQIIPSPQFPDLAITPAQILLGPRNS